MFAVLAYIHLGISCLNAPIYYYIVIEVKCIYQLSYGRKFILWCDPGSNRDIRIFSPSHRPTLLSHQKVPICQRTI